VESRPRVGIAKGGLGTDGPAEGTVIKVNIFCIIIFIFAIPKRGLQVIFHRMFI